MTSAKPVAQQPDTRIAELAARRLPFRTTFPLFPRFYSPYRALFISWRDHETCCRHYQKRLLVWPFFRALLQPRCTRAVARCYFWAVVRRGRTIFAPICHLKSIFQYRRYATSAKHLAQVSDMSFAALAVQRHFGHMRDVVLDRVPLDPRPFFVIPSNFNRVARPRKTSVGATSGVFRFDRSTV